MARTCFTLLSLAGLLFSLGLWVASFFRVSYTAGQTTVLLEYGAVRFLHLENPLEPTFGAWHRWGSGGWIVEHLLPRYARHPTADAWSVAIPLWMPIVFFTPLLWLSRLSRLRLEKATFFTLRICLSRRQDLPELACLDSDEEKNVALQKAACNRFLNLSFSIIGLVYVCSIAPYLRYQLALHRPSVPQALAALGLLLLFILIPLGYLLCCLRQVRASLRGQLLEKGFVFCARCKYDLRGQVESRCPECGQSFDRPPLKQLESKRRIHNER